MPEWHSRPGVVLTDHEARALAGTRAVTVAPSWGGGWTLTTSSIVGIVSVGGIQLVIEPKVPVQRLIYLLMFAHADGWRDDDTDVAPEADLAHALGHAFTVHAERALRSGVLQGYVTREESAPVLRGRLREGAQLRRHFGFPVPVEIRYDDFTIDIVENQLLLGAARVLMRLPVDARLRRRLARMHRLLEDVTPWPPRRRTALITFDRLNLRYRPAIRLARLILDGASMTARSGSTTATGLLFDMNRVFEDFLSAVLGDALKNIGGSVVPQHAGHMDVHCDVDLRPDLTWWRNDRCLAVIDAKYKAGDGKGPRNPDLYQMLTYCTAYNVDDGFLVYAEPAAEWPTIEVRHSPARLHAVGLDLGRPSHHLWAAVDQLAHHIASFAELINMDDARYMNVRKS